MQVIWVGNRKNQIWQETIEMEKLDEVSSEGSLRLQRTECYETDSCDDDDAESAKEVEVCKCDESEENKEKKTWAKGHNSWCMN